LGGVRALKNTTRAPTSLDLDRNGIPDECRERFRRGNANADDNTDLSDAVFVLSYLFLGGATPACMKSADTDDSGTLDITDAVYLLNYLFLGNPAPSSPFPDCGPDPTEDELGCETYPPCQEQ
jgi:hypothetical protein